MATSRRRSATSSTARIRIALDQRSVTCLIVPNDLGEEPAVRSRRASTARSTRLPDGARPRIVPETADLRRAAEILNAGEKVAILVGQGALGAHDEVIAGRREARRRRCEGAARQGRRSTTTLPYCTGSIGLLGTKPSWTLMNECDTLLMVGSSFPYSEFLPEPGQARGVQIDIDGRMLNIRYPMELGLVGDAKATLRS